MTDSASPQRVHDVMVANIAFKMRVPTWELHVNVGDSARRGIPVPGADEVFPDILAFEKYTHRLAAIGAVETADTLATCAAQWKLYSMLASKFFAYVPEDCLEEAMRLCRRHGLDNRCVRVYYYNQRNRLIIELGWRARKRKAEAPPGE